MKILKRKTLMIGSLLVCAYSVCTAQDYYGGSGGSWRKQPANNSQPKDKGDNGNPEPSGYISINFGFATPEGSFAQPFPEGSYGDGATSAYGTGYGNYALPGSGFNFSLGVPINHSNFGVAFMFGSYNNEYDLNSYVNGLYNSNISYNAYSNSPITYYSTAPSQNEYSESSIMGGFFATYPLGRLSIDCRLMIGVLLSSLPEQNIYAGDADGDALQYDIQSSNATSLAFDGGIGARFMIAELGRRKLCAMVNVDYLYSSVSYNTQQYITVIPATPPTGYYPGQPIPLVPNPIATGTLPIELLNVTFGIGYQL